MAWIEISIRVVREAAAKAELTLEQLGALAVFLCTEGSAQITGTPLSVDGGWTAH